MIVIEYLSVRAPTQGLSRNITLWLIAERPEGSLEKVGVSQGPGAGQEARVIASIRAAKPVVVAGERGAVGVIENRGDERNLVCFRFVEGTVGRGMEKSVV